MLATAQTSTPRSSSNYEAANWSTWLLENPQQIKTEAPPAAAQTKSELHLIQGRMSKLDAKKLEQIKYWNAGRLLTAGTRLHPADQSKA